MALPLRIVTWTAGIRFCSAPLACVIIPLLCLLLCFLRFLGFCHFCLPMPWGDFLVQGAQWKRWGAITQRRQTSLRIHLSRARGVVVSHPLSMREALGSIPSVSILVHHADGGRKGKTNGAQAARPAIMAPRQLSPQSGQRAYSGLGKLADSCAPWGVAVQRNRRAHTHTRAQ